MPQSFLSIHKLQLWGELTQTQDISKTRRRYIAHERNNLDRKDVGLKMVDRSNILTRCKIFTTKGLISFGENKAILPQTLP